TDMVVGSVIGTAVAGGVWLVGRREQRAADDAAGLRVELEGLREQAAAAERQRIARELHDILAHSVSAMMMQAAGARAMARAIARDEQAAGAGQAGDGEAGAGQAGDGRTTGVGQAADEAGAGAGSDERWAS